MEFEKGKSNSANSVWNSFLREVNGKTALCKLCDKAGHQKILKTAKGSTSGMRSHLKSFHSDSATRIGKVI